MLMTSLAKLTIHLLLIISQVGPFLSFGQKQITAKCLQCKVFDSGYIAGNAIVHAAFLGRNNACKSFLLMAKYVHACLLHEFLGQYTVTMQSSFFFFFFFAISMYMTSDIVFTTLVLHFY